MQTMELRKAGTNDTSSTPQTTPGCVTSLETDKATPMFDMCKPTNERRVLSEGETLQKMQNLIVTSLQKIEETNDAEDECLQVVSEDENVDFENIILETGNVSDLRDVVEAINRLCDTMMSSDYSEKSTEVGDVDEQVPYASEFPMDVSSREHWETTNSDTYYTASSEVSVVSDLELADRIQDDCMHTNREYKLSVDNLKWDDIGSDSLSEFEPCEREANITNLQTSGSNGIVAETEVVVVGHVAAMRVKFETITARATTPCPDYTLQ